jgi:hypothetical protein
VGKVLIAAVSLVALAGSAEAAKVKMPNGVVRHTWFQFMANKGTCEQKSATPEEFWNYMLLNGAQMGIVIDPIKPENVDKDAAGNVHVTVTATRNGSPGHFEFFTSSDACNSYAGLHGGYQAPSADIN